MNRYFFYLIAMVMVVNVMAYVPSILISERYEGAIMGSLVGIMISTILIYVFSKSLMKFPNKDIPQIFEEMLPKWVRIPFLVYFASMWYLAGTLVLITFTAISKRFINPDMSLTNIAILFIIATALTAIRSSKTVLYILEIAMIIGVPFIVFIILKAVASKYLMWDAIQVMHAYVWEFPTFNSIAASTYTFVGYINMAVFNRVFEGEFNTKFFWLIPIVGVLNLFVTTAVPIGFHGTEGVDDFPYIWVITSDTMRLELAFIERVLFPFLLLYVNVSLLFASTAWHVALEMLKSVLPKNNASSKWVKYVPYFIMIAFAIPAIVALHLTNQPMLLTVVTMFLKIRLVSEIFLVGLLFFLSKRRGKTS